MSRARRTRNRNGETGFTSFRRKDTNWSLRSEGGVRVGRHRDRRFPADAIYPNIRGPGHAVCAATRRGALCKQDAGTAYRSGGGAGKRSDVERYATGFFLTSWRIRFEAQLADA